MAKKKIDNTKKTCKKTPCSKTCKNKKSTEPPVSCDSDSKNQKKTLWQKIKSWFI